VFLADGGNPSAIRDASRRRDPTGTLAVRQRFWRELEGRLRTLKRLITQAVTERDVLGIGTVSVGSISAAAMQPHDPDAPHPGIMGPPTSGRTVTTFQRWVDAALEQTLLGKGSLGAWLEPHVKAAYRLGAERAGQLAGVTPTYDPDRVEVLQRLAVVELQGIMEVISQKAVRAVGEGMLTNQRAPFIGRAINQVVDRIGLVRGRMLTDTFSVRAHAEATLDVFVQANVKKVGLIPEYLKPIRLGDAGEVEVLTAGDDDVCEECEDISDNGPYDLDEARGLIPAHPRCRCAFVPFFDERFADPEDPEWFEEDAAFADNFNEGDHPRDKDGKFASGGGGGGEEEAGGAGGGLVAAPDRSTWPAHIQELGVPPAWTNVRISMDPNADLQVVGRDAKGRSQYVYSERFAESQAAAKFERIRELNAKYDKIAEQVSGLRGSSDPRIAEHADTMALIMETGIRPGGTGDTGAEKQAYGATTLESRHVHVGSDGGVSLRFVGKKGVDLDIPVKDRGIAAMLKERAAAGGQLFPNVSAASLSGFTKELNGGGFKTKDFRTSVGTRTALAEIGSTPTPKDAKSYKKAVMAVAKVVSTRLGNTPTVALQAYIDPTVFTRWRNEASV